MMGSIQPHFGGTAYYLPNTAESTTRLFTRSMHDAVGQDRFEMRHIGGEGPHGELLGDAIAFCKDDKTEKVFRKRGFHKPEPITRELVLRCNADSMQEALEAYPMLAMLSVYGGEPPEADGISGERINAANAFQRLRDDTICREPAMRIKPQDQNPKDQD